MTLDHNNIYFMTYISIEHSEWSQDIKNTITSYVTFL